MPQKIGKYVKGYPENVGKCLPMPDTGGNCWKLVENAGRCWRMLEDVEKYVGQ